MKKLLNIDEISSIRVHEKLWAGIYYEGPINTTFKQREERFVKYTGLGHRRYWTRNELINSGYLLEGNRVYYEPHFDAKMKNGDGITIYFKTLDELNKALSELKSKTNLIEFE